MGRLLDIGRRLGLGSIGPLRTFREHLRRREFERLPVTAVDAEHLGDCTAARLRDAFASATVTADWERDRAVLAKLGLPEMTGGVNPGDQRALYHLVRALNPSSLLEIGTHLGCSTVNLALAARGPTVASNGNAAPIVTCDIADVNDPVRQPWLRYGSKHSPAALLELAGCRGLVEFRIADSCDYLRNVDRRFDLIFLDGDHSAAAVYRELPLALKALRPNGLVLLHDYYPDGTPLWPDDPGLPGPALAVGRLLAEGAPIRVLPLGELPWLTRSGSRITSLALVVRAEQ